ncbi:MAG: adenosylcobinamide-GDP ribazoletransferase [Zetaproteobacteria bacterium]|nr:MAG: adenosylcobinamide-GDP ribazoletransferase [Zetaproteobacteria bacterium]
MRGLLVAIGLLTRIPVPIGHIGQEGQWPRTAVWFPLVGLLIGALVVSALTLAQHQASQLAALLGVLVWVGITGGLHLDGAADLADALGSAHRDPERFHAVMKDPHVGSFAIMAILFIVLIKLQALAMMVGEDGRMLALVLIPAWARLAAVFWSQVLPPIAPGMGERFSSGMGKAGLVGWLILLALASVAAGFSVLVWVALLTMSGWWVFLRSRVGGFSGDCMGAGIEWMECLLLLAMVFS